MRTELRFIDPCAPHAYARDADLRGLGGTEATLLRIAVALAGNGAVTVEQAARHSPAMRGEIAFLPMDLTRQAGSTIIVINSWKVALICARRNPGARIWVWQHVFPGRHNRVLAPDMAAAGIGIICVSESHAAMVRALLGGQVEVLAIPNPIADDLHPDATPRDPDLLFFASSPHKGLDQVLAAFATLRETLPGLRLELADPGYLVCDSGVMPPGVVVLGTLSRAEVIARMRRALCLFYPQWRFEETFGLVIAEANAVGCPALVHRGLGANDEVTWDASQRIDATSPHQIAARIAAWRSAPPLVSLWPRFRFSAVLAQWVALLAPGASASPFASAPARPAPARHLSEASA
ncbi:glycosyltransferase [Paracoccaceae bacterium Fryx2]|nr:glycosyltransferase [Paracoccaceae bacterium Fryx2]